MARLDTDRQKELEPERMEYAASKISELGYEIIMKDGNQISFVFKGESVSLFPYSGWHTGKGIKDGRGLEKLLKQL